MLSLANDIGCETIILGDVNINYLKKNDHKRIKDIIKTNGFEQIIKEATRTTEHSSTLINVIFTNRPSTISHHGVFGTSLSDHD